MSPAVERVLRALKACGCDPRPTGKGWSFNCPAHADTHASGTLSEGDDGRALIHCHAGCGIDALLKHAGLEARDLFSDSDADPRPREPGHHSSAPADPRAGAIFRGESISAVYDYHNEGEAILFRVCRTPNKEFPVAHPDPTSPTGWRWGLGGVRRVLYCLPVVIDTVRNGGTVYVVEGEKDADAINGLDGSGFCATTNPGGAGKWRPEYNDSLRGARIVIIRDRDPAGKKHACDAAASLRGVATSVEIREAAIGKDVSDHIAAGRSLNELLAVPDVEPDREPQQHAEPAAKASEALPVILVPGQHASTEGPVEIGNDDFARPAVAAVPPGLLYRRGPILGELVGPRGGASFESCENPRLRILVDGIVSLVELRYDKRTKKIRRTYLACETDHATLIRAEAIRSDRVRNLRLLTSFPVLAGDDLEVVKPGWNEAHGIYYDVPPDLVNVEPIHDKGRIHEILSDLVIDFPFRDDASRENFFGLFLTYMLRRTRWARKRPFNYAGATLERVGKGKLVVDTFGGIVLGRPAPIMTWTGSEEEREKRVIALLRASETLLILDNLSADDFLDSQVLAALLTGETYRGRLLGVSECPTFDNTLLIIATGNNTRMSGEIAKRTVPILLAAKTDAPEERTDFVHPDLHAHVQRVRPAVVGALLGMVENWTSAGRPGGSQTMGGFEEWARTVGGIMTVNGFTRWYTNTRAWRRQADPDGEDLRALVEAWASKHLDEHITAKQLVAITLDLGIFPHVLKSKEEGRPATLGRMLRKNMDTPVGGYFIRATGCGNASLYWLDPQ